MNFKDIDIKISYKSVGDRKISHIVDQLLNESIYYKRSVGFFDSSALDFISDGIYGLVNNRGKIYLITSPKLSEDDVKAINAGYIRKEQCLYHNFKTALTDTLEKFDDENLNYIVELISNDVLNIKIATKKNYGMYHDKVAILCDRCGNKVAFAGSNNETSGGYDTNWEKVRVFKSWNESGIYVDDEEEDFDKIWNNSDENLDTLDFMDAIKKDVIEYQKSRPKSKKEKYDLYDYQKDAINSWINKDYRGFFVMATGTGKTVTSIYASKELISRQKIFTVIAVPYKHLVTQWYEDVKDIFGDSVDIIKISSENHNWTEILTDTIFKNRLGEHKNIIVISTINSFCSDKFAQISPLIKEDRLLIVDEAHNFLNKINNYSFDEYKYRLGLSATPVFGNDKNKTEQLCNFFGGIAYQLPIEKAIGKFLVNYNYYPIFVHSNEVEEKKFMFHSKIMASLRDPTTKEIKKQDDYMKAYRNRLSVIANVEDKVSQFGTFIDRIKEHDHFIIYCSDGKSNDERYLNQVVRLLNEKGFKPSQFTCTENMKTRESLINNFDSGLISTLVAIRCLDEGINIKSIKTALILSSNDNYREFVQRRGRILRKHKSKTVANIYDIIVLPSLNCPGIAEIELRRYKEYARLAINKENDQLLEELQHYLNYYGLTENDISFDTIDEMDGEMDD